MSIDRLLGGGMTVPDDLRAAEPSYGMFVRDLVISCSIGAYPHERLAPQRVRLNVDLNVREAAAHRDDLGDVVSYDTIVAGIKALVAGRHINLVETLAEEIASLCLDEPRVLSARVRVEKLDVEPAATSVGVEIERRRHRRRAAEIVALPYGRGAGGEGAG
ncbi:MAG: dihydroneopterin aldolase [Dongiaceae bacterium]